MIITHTRVCQFSYLQIVKRLLGTLKISIFRCFLLQQSLAQFWVNEGQLSAIMNRFVCRQTILLTGGLEQGSSQQATVWFWEVSSRPCGTGSGQHWREPRNTSSSIFEHMRQEQRVHVRAPCRYVIFVTQVAFNILVNVYRRHWH